MGKTLNIHVARIYDHRGASSDPNELRVLVDRLWPRGVSKEDAAIDVWAKEVTPSTELRKTWHGDPDGHSPDHFKAFEAAYASELDKEPAKSALAELAANIADAGSVLLLTAAKSPDMSHVPTLVDALTRQRGLGSAKLTTKVTSE